LTKRVISDQTIEVLLWICELGVIIKEASKISAESVGLYLWSKRYTQAERHLQTRVILNPSCC
jgi:hypothetical protein